ncbi:hypothetical protein F5051DRAFT_71197 [Lentinula edodes]|nr:hypothetical protein F5051DRAFT_71197 [Lentinula edodes]
MLLLYVELFYLILTNTTGDVFLLVCLLFPGSSSASLQGSCHDAHTHMLVQAYTTSSASFHLSKVQESTLAQHHPLLPRAANPLSFPLCSGVLEVQKTCGGVTVYRTDLAFEFLRLYADAWDAIDKLTCCGWTGMWTTEAECQWIVS